MKTQHKVLTEACSTPAVCFISCVLCVSDQVYVLKRPHVDEFLKRMGELFECVLFTASLAKVRLHLRDTTHKHCCGQIYPVCCVKWNLLFHYAQYYWKTCACVCVQFIADPPTYALTHKEILRYLSGNPRFNFNIYLKLCRPQPGEILVESLHHPLLHVELSWEHLRLCQKSNAALPLVTFTSLNVADITSLWLTRMSGLTWGSETWGRLVGAICSL